MWARASATRHTIPLRFILNPLWTLRNHTVSQVRFIASAVALLLPTSHTERYPFKKPVHAKLRLMHALPHMAA